MKARIKATGEIVEVFPYNKDGFAYIHEDGETVYEAIELEVDEFDLDYWTRLEHQYAGMAMQGILHQWGVTYISCSKSKEQHLVIVVNAATEIAHALVEKMKEERK